MTKKILITAALTAAMIGSALADDVDLIKGPMTYTNGLTGQVLAAKNNTAAILNMGIECAFLGKHDELLAGLGAVFWRLEPGETGHDKELLGRGHAYRTDCCISMAQQFIDDPADLTRSCHTGIDQR